MRLSLPGSKLPARPNELKWIRFITTFWSLLKNHYYSFKIFPKFWLAKSTRIIHHNQLLMTKFGRILCLTRKWRQKCSPLQVKVPLPRRPGDEVELFWLWKQKWRTLPSFQEYELQLEVGEIIAKNIAKTVRRQRGGRHLLFGEYLRSWTNLNVHYWRWT